MEKVDREIGQANRSFSSRAALVVGLWRARHRQVALDSYGIQTDAAFYGWLRRVTCEGVVLAHWGRNILY
jgi:hypothetical protein